MNIKSGINEHCDEAKRSQMHSTDNLMVKHKVCCDHHASDFAHCNSNNCFQSVCTVIGAIRLPLMISSSESNRLINVDLHYPQPTLELFKPPI